MASSSKGTSLTVNGDPFGRVSASMSRSSSQGAKRRSCCGLQNNWSTSHSPVIGSQARFSVLRKCVVHAQLLHHIRQARPAPARSQACPTYRLRMADQHARARRSRAPCCAAAACAWHRRWPARYPRARWARANPLMRMTGRCEGTRSRAATALAIALAIRRSPLSLAACGSSCAVAMMPGIRSAMVRLTTPVSPSEGSTWSM